MKVVSYPGCCTAKILIGFGQEANAGYDARVTGRQTKEDLKVEVDKAIRGHLIGRHNGIVSACLTSRQTNGIAALTELGFHSSGAKVKTGHRESQLLTFYINPKEYLDTNPQAYQAPVVPGAPQATKRYVKDLNTHAAWWYRTYMDRARDSEKKARVALNPERAAHWSDYAVDMRARAKALLTVDTNFA